MKEHVSEEEWDAVNDFFRQEYKEKHPVRYWIEEIRFKIEMFTRKFIKKDEIPF
tara:strand:- start:4867 stop:5028 length:162 start_codon:yes stop_codon:yes gene_type:complete